MRFGRFEEERIRLGWSKERLAAALGCSIDTLETLSNGTAGASLAARSAAIFGCTLDYLLGLSDKRDRRWDTTVA